MTARSCSTLIVFATLSACAQLPPEQQLIADAVDALGGRGRIESVATLVVEGEGVMGNLGQDMTPDSTSQAYEITDYSLTADLSTPRYRLERTRTPNFEYFRGRDPMRQVYGLDGDIAYDVAPDESASRASDAVANERRAAYYRHPLTALRAAIDPAATIANPRAASGERLVDVTTADGFELTIALDATTSLPNSVTTRSNHPNLRDVSQRTSFTDYEEVGGLMLPARLTGTTDSYRTFQLEFSSQTVNADIDDISAPEQARSQEAFSGPPPANVTVEEVADGVWFLAGQSHHSVLIELSDHLVLFEAPNEVRALAVIEKARELVPGKPLTHLINSHHHFDHSGGIRASVSEGLNIITHAENVAFYQELAERPSTIVPDVLARNAQPATIEAVEDHATHGRGAVTIELYHITDNPHGDTLLMAYLPRQRLLIEADAFSPGRAYQPFAANLLENVQRRGLRVDRIVPVHGAVVPFSELVSAVEAME